MAKVIGETKANSLELDLDALGACGVQGQIVIEALFADDRYRGKDRHQDSTLRPFFIRARLSRHPPDDHDLRGDIQPNDGSSYIMVPPDKAYLEIGTAAGVLRLDVNERREASMVSCTIKATNPGAALADFQQSITTYLNRMSYLFSAPSFITLTNVHDVENELQYIHFTSPPRHFETTDVDETLFEEMQPVYALYREAQNTSSPYYRLLCFSKIMEGLLGPLRANVQKRAKEGGIGLQQAKAVVPDHADIAGGLRHHVGQPLKSYYDTFLTKEYRDAVAHFELRARSALNVSSPADLRRFGQVAFLTDLCVRVLIERHEKALAIIAGGATA